MFTEMRVPNLLAFAIIFGVIVLIALIGNVFVNPKSGGAFVVVIGGLWTLALLTVPIQSANAVASERMNERLGPILTTPLTAREILDEWLGPVRRWIQFLVRPLVVIFAVEAVIKYFTQDPDDWRGTTVVLSLSISVLTVLIYPALVQWSCLWIGLRIRNQIRALMTSLLVVVAWCLIPLAAYSYLANTGLFPTEWNEALSFVSPITVIRTAEAFGRNAPETGVTTQMIVMAFAQLGLAAALMAWVRRWCLTNADRHLGRI